MSEPVFDTLCYIVSLDVVGTISLQCVLINFDMCYNKIILCNSISNYSNIPQC